MNRVRNVTTHGLTAHTAQDSAQGSEPDDKTGQGTELEGKAGHVDTVF